MQTHASTIAAVLGTALFAAGSPAATSAQVGGSGLSRPRAAPAVAHAAVAELPFLPGEVLEYSVTVARLRLGHGSLAVEEVERVAGVRTYRVALEVEIRTPFLKFRDREVSWVATDSLRSMAFERYRVEGSREEHLRFRFDHNASSYDRETWDPGSGIFRPVPGGTDAGGAMPADAIDEVAALYLLRTLPLEPGTVHRLDRYFDPAGNPIVFRVVGREVVRVPAGRFETIVVEPDIPAVGAFRASKEPRIYVTDDARRLIVKITTRTKAGPLAFYLERMPRDRAAAR